MIGSESISSPLQAGSNLNTEDAALFEPHTEIVILREFDVKKNGRNRRITLEVHRTPLPETGLPNNDNSHAFNEKTFLRISKFNYFGFKNKLAKVYNYTGQSIHSDDASIVSQDATEYNDYTPTIVSAQPSSRNTNSAHSYSPTPGNRNSNALLTVPESDTENNSIASPPRVHTKDPSRWVSRYLLDLDRVQISSLTDKRVTVNLRYKADKDSEERHFVFISEHEAKDFRDTTQHEKIQERARAQSKLASALQSAGLRYQAKNIAAFETERLEFLVEIVGAEDLAAEDLTSSDPYVVCQFGDQILHKTKYISKNLNPVFTLRKNAFFLWSVTVKDLFVEADGLTLVVYDFDFSAGIGERHEVLGAATVPAKDIFNAKEERLCYLLKPITIGKKTKGHNKGKIAIRIRRATEHDKEFLATYEEYRKKNATTGILSKADKSKKKERGEHGVSALRSFTETKVRTFIGDDGCKSLKYKAMPRPDPQKTTETEWMSTQEIETNVMKPSRKYEYIGNGKIARVYLEILSCDNLPNMEGVMGRFGNKTDGFVQIVYEDCICKTEVVDDKNNPRFLPWTRRAFVLHTNYPSSVINLGVFDYDPGAALINDHDLIGRASVDVTNLRPGTEYMLNYTLHNTSIIQKKRKSNLGTIKIRLRIEVDDPRAYLLASLQLPPSIYVNSSSSKDFECVHQTCCGEYNMNRYSLDTIKELVDELQNHQRIYYYIYYFMRALILWRGSHTVSILGKQFSVPVNSICTFLMAIKLVENPHLLPSFSFLTIGFVLMYSMAWRNTHPSPWWRCPNFLQLAKILAFGNSAGLEPEMIAENERAEEAACFDNKWTELIESAEKKTAARALEVAKEQGELQKELDDVGGADAEITSKVGPRVNLNPLQVAKKYLFPIQQMLVSACEWTRFAKNILLWEESYYSFWVTLLSFILAFVSFFVPWVFIIKWTARITAWLLFGPLMKIVDVYVLTSDDETAAESEAKAQEADRLGRKKSMEKMIEGARVRNELSYKLRDFKQYFFGKFLTKVSILKADRFIDIPLSTSTATPYNNKISFVGGDLVTSDAAANRERGQHLTGLMIPIVKEKDEILGAVVEEHNLDSAPIESMKMGGAICIAATMTYFLVPFLIYMVKSSAKYLDI